MKILLPLLMLLTVSSFAQVPKIEPGVSHDLAIWRAAHYSDIRYKLNLTLEKMSPVLTGSVEIHVIVEEEKGRKGEGETKPGTQASLPAAPQSGVVPPIILDWRKIAGHEKDSIVSNVTINGHRRELMPKGDYGSFHDPFYMEFDDHLVFEDGVQLGENVIKLDFTSPILTSGSAITRYIDKEDGSEYIYSLFVPSDASTAFPVFDQPDLKARFKLDLHLQTNRWTAVSNGKWDGMVTTRQCTSLPDRSGKVEYPPDCGNDVGFDETKPISTYVFAFAAGPFEEFHQGFRSPGIVTIPDGEEEEIARENEYQGRVSPKVYVRRSQAEKFKPHAAETFRLMREGIKYFEDYFDYKFPFPKYDLVLIPEFPFGGMEHAGATFVREQSIIFPTEPTASDKINRATLIFHETAHQWFGDTVTMKWFDDLWLKEGFANFMAYKALEKIMPETNAWKVFYERIKQPAYATDSTRGTTPIYQPINNLSAAKSAYGNIVYNKAPAFLRQAEFYLGPDKFQTAVRAFLKKHEYANATWEDLVSEFEAASGKDLKEWASEWVKQCGLSFILPGRKNVHVGNPPSAAFVEYYLRQQNVLPEKARWLIKTNVLLRSGEKEEVVPVLTGDEGRIGQYWTCCGPAPQNNQKTPDFVFPNYQDYGYGIFLLDDKSRDYVLKNIQNEKDPFLRSMMWGALWDSVREAELDPKEYVELVIKNLGGDESSLRKPARSKGIANGESSAMPLLRAGFRNEDEDAKARASARAKETLETDETIIQSILGHALTALNYYITDAGVTGGNATVRERAKQDADARSLTVASLPVRLENVLIERMKNAPTLGARITFYRAFLGIAASEKGRTVLKDILNLKFEISNFKLKTKDRFDIVTRLAVLGDPEAEKLLADLEKTETGDDAKRYAYAAHAAFATKENREKFWNDFINNKQISESWIEAAMGPFNSIGHDDLSLPYLERALKELPNLKRDRKIFFVNGWLGAFIGGQKSQRALDIVNKFLADNPNLDNDLRLKILENVDTIERSVKIRSKYN